MFDKFLTYIRYTLLTIPFLISMWQPVVADPLLQEFDVVYTFTRNGMNIGKLNHSLHAASDDKYVLESVSEATGFISLFVRDKIIERSIWTYINGKPRPLQYIYHRNGGSKERNVKLSFDWKEGVVTNTINNDPWQMHIPPAAQDKLLYQLMLMIDLKAGKKKLHYKIADGGRLKDYEFVILGEEKIDTPVGKLDTLKLQRVDDVRHTTIWCAKSLDYLPVRIEQVERDDSRLALQIREVKGLPAAGGTESAETGPE